VCDISEAVIKELLKKDKCSKLQLYSRTIDLLYQDIFIITTLQTFTGVLLQYEYKSNNHILSYYILAQSIYARSFA